VVIMNDLTIDVKCEDVILVCGQHRTAAHGPV